jgi:hypothetical protein
MPRRALELLAARLVLRRQLERLAERLQRLVVLEADVAAGELEEHAAGLAEVDRVEVLAVDDVRGARAGLDGLRTHGLELGVVGRRPCDVVDGPGARGAALLRRLVVAQERVALVAAQRPFRAAVVAEAQRLQKRRAGVGPRRVGAHAVEAQQRVLGRHVGRAGGQRSVVGGHRVQLVAQALEVGEGQRVAVALGGDALVAQARRPEGERVGGGHAPLDGVDHPRAGVARRCAGELEEGQDRAGRAALVAEVQVVDVGLVEVDRLLDEAQPEQARVEVDVAWSVAGDGGDVVQALECHALDFPLFPGSCLCNNS